MTALVDVAAMVVRCLVVVDDYCQIISLNYLVCQTPPYPHPPLLRMGPSYGVVLCFAQTIPKFCEKCARKNRHLVVW